MVHMSAEVYAACAALGKVLLKVLLAQAVGYFMKTKKLIPAEALSGIGAFAGLVSLPALLFKAVAILDFTTVDVTIVVAITAGKVLLVAVSAGLGSITGSSSKAGSTELTAGCFGLLTTNSDDLGLGLPVLGAIFPPQLVSMCYVLNALQAMIINPLIFILFGIGKARRDAPTDGTPPASNADIIIAVLHGLTKNFLILSVVSGVAYNAIFGGFRGAKLPFFADDLCTLLASAFGAVVQFLAGAANVGSFEKLAALDSAILPLLTVLLKSVLLPTFVMCIVSALGGSRDILDFAFAFNCLPTAGSTLVFARPYAPGPQLDSLLASGLALGKLIGFPLLFLAAAIFKTEDVHDILALEQAVGLSMQCISAVALVPMILSTLWYRPWRKSPLRLLLALVFGTFGFTTASAAARLGLVLPRVAYPVISFFRWFSEAVLMLSVLSRHIEATHRLAITTAKHSSSSAPVSARSPRDLEAPLLLAHSGEGPRLFHTTLLAYAFKLLLAVAAGLALTLPWTLSSEPFPGSEDSLIQSEVKLPLWVPYGDLQEMVYAHVYGLCALLVFASSSYMMRIAAQTKAILTVNYPDGKDKKGKEALPLRLHKLKSAHSFYVRFECLAFIVGTRLSLSAAICLQLAFDAEDAKLTGSMALMLLANSFIANSTGLLLFFLFGLGEGLFDPQRLFRRPGAAPGAPTRTRPRLAGRRSVQVEELLEAAQQVAGGTGYEQPPKLKSVFKRATAAMTIQRYNRAHLGPGHPAKKVTAVATDAELRQRRLVSGSPFRRPSVK